MTGHESESASKMRLLGMEAIWDTAHSAKCDFVRTLSPYGKVRA